MSCRLDRSARLWDVATGACRVLPVHTDHVFAAAFHLDGSRLATAGRDRREAEALRRRADWLVEALARIIQRGANNGASVGV